MKPTIYITVFANSEGVKQPSSNSDKGTGSPRSLLLLAMTMVSVSAKMNWGGVS